MFKLHCKLLYTACFVFLLSKISAQTNLVPNPSFEDTLYCPLTLADLSAIKFWSAPTQGSADYFNNCTNNPNIGIPNNVFGIQPTHSGNAYVGISVYDSQNSYSYREYIQVQLKQQLINGQKYFISFYVSLSDYNDFGIKELGAYFSNIQILNNTMDTTLTFLPQVEFNDNVISDKDNWTKITGSFLASGTENFLIIGNFKRNQTTTASQVSNNNIKYAYYYVDDVCVSDDSTTCANPISIIENKINSTFLLFPNPANEHINIKSNSKELFNICIYNSIGQLIHFEENKNISNLKINISNYKSDIMFIKIKSNNEEFKYKFLKQ